MPISKRLRNPLLLYLGFALLGGCATTNSYVAPQKAAVGQAKRIGVFVWQGQPFYNKQVGSGIIGLGASTGNTLYSSMSGGLARNMSFIANSGVYQAFQAEFLRDFSHVVSVPVVVLNPKAYVYSGTGKTRRVDPVASAKAQGDDVILEATVWPSEFVYKGNQNSRMPTTQNTVKVDFYMHRVTDGKVLWRTSFTGKGTAGFKKLAQLVAKKAADIYGSSH